MNNFDENRIKSIIRMVKKTINCPHCGSSFSDRGIRFVGGQGTAYLVRLTCDSCGLGMVASLVQVNENNDSGFTLNSSSVDRVENGEIISSDDLIGLHTYLKDFSGDFRSMWRK